MGNLFIQTLVQCVLLHCIQKKVEKSDFREKVPARNSIAPFRAGFMGWESNGGSANIDAVAVCYVALLPEKLQNFLKNLLPEQYCRLPQLEFVLICGIISCHLIIRSI